MPPFESVTIRGERIMVLEGDFQGFAIDEVLDVMALSRQAMMLRTYRGEPIVAELVIKAGRVLRAVHGRHRDPLAVLVALRADPGDGEGALALFRSNRTCGLMVFAAMLVVGLSAAG